MKVKEYFLKTERLGFSTWGEGDLDLATSLWGDPQVTRLICASGVFSPGEIQARLQTEIDNLATYGIQYWPIFSLETGELVGCCGLRPFNTDLDIGVVELGFHIRSPFWGQRYAYEAGKAVLIYAFDVLGAKEVAAGHHPQNTASKKVLQRLGFRYSHDEFYPPTGLNHPSYRYR